MVTIMAPSTANVRASFPLLRRRWLLPGKKIEIIVGADRLGLFQSRWLPSTSSKIVKKLD